LFSQFNLLKTLIVLLIFFAQRINQIIPEDKITGKILGKGVGNHT